MKDKKYSYVGRRFEKPIAETEKKSPVKKSEDSKKKPSENIVEDDDFGRVPENTLENFDIRGENDE